MFIYDENHVQLASRDMKGCKKGYSPAPNTATHYKNHISYADHTDHTGSQTEQMNGFADHTNYG